MKIYREAGHDILVESGAGDGSSISNEEYIEVGARILNNTEDIWHESDMIVKVKEPLPQELELIKPEQVIYKYFHFAADENMTKKCMERKITTIAYETVQKFCKPVSEILQ